ncbi:Pao retrotransposon peptidase family protein [Aphelenchoides avenae]|nr:Pao retrotransposon peptidase family protein [Aphelenchus avenae]
MYGNHYQTRTIRRFQRTYEDRTFRHRRQIEYIASKHQQMQGAIQDLQPTLTDDVQRRTEMIAQIRANITELQDHLVDYNEAKDAWKQIITEYVLIDHPEDDWALAMLQQYRDCCPDVEPSPLAKLLQEYRDLLVAVEDNDSVTHAQDAPAASRSSASTTQESEAAAVHARPPTPLSLGTAFNDNDSHASSAARALFEEPAAQGSEPSHNDGEDTFVAEEQEAPTSEPSHADGEDASDADSFLGGNSPRPPPAHALPSPVHHFYSPGPSYEQPLRQSDDSDEETVVTDQTEYEHPLHDPSHPGAVPIVHQLDHGDGTTPSGTPQYDDYEFGYTTPFMDDHGAQGPTGLFAYADGNVSRATSTAWHTPYVGGDTQVTVAAPAPTRRHSKRPDSPPVSSDEAPKQPPSVNHPMASTTEPAGGRGPSSAPPSGPGPVDDSGPQPLSAVTNEAAGATATPPTSTALADQKSTSAFYNNATYHRSKDATAPPLVLQELPITPFEGNVRQYPAFRDRFLEVVENRLNLEPRHKLQYLLPYLRGEPHRLANGFPLTNESYFAVVDMLEERYGNKNIIRNLLLSDLVALQAPSSGVADLRRFHDEAFQVTTGLRQLGEDVDNNHLYEQTLMAKLSQELKTELIRNSNYAQEMTVTSILNGLHHYIQVLELTYSTGVSWISQSRPRSHSPHRPNGLTRARSPAPHFSKQREHQVTYAAQAQSTQTTGQPQPRSRCAFCGEKHFSSLCTRYRTVSQRIKRLRLLGSCFLCLQGNHWVKECPKRTDDFCRFCKVHRHHRAVCYEAHQDQQRDRPRRDPARTQEPAGRTSAGGPAAGRQGVDQRQFQAQKAVTWKDSIKANDSTAAEKASPSTHMSSKPQQGKSNSTRIPRKKRSRSQGTGFKGRDGTPRPTTASTAESMEQKGIDAYDGERLLAEHKSLLPTDGCSKRRELRCFAEQDPSRPLEERLHEDALLQIQLAEEDSSSLPSSIGHCSNYDSDAFSEPEQQSNEWFPPYQEASGYAVTATQPADTPAVLLECVKVAACNPFNGKSRDIIAFFDLGSSMTFVSTELALDLELPRYQRQKLCVNTFASKAPRNIDSFTTELVLRSQRGTFTRLKLTASDCIVPSLRTALVEDSELPALQKNECALISSRETPDILIGQDTIQLFRRQTGQRLPSGFDIVDSFLGPMIGGAGKVANIESKAVPTSTAADASERTGPHCQGHQECPADGSDGSHQDTVIQFPPPPSNFNITSEEPVSGYFSSLAVATDSQIFGDFSFLENAGIGTCEMTPDDQAAADMLDKLITREPDGRYKVPPLFRTANGEPPSNDDLPTNMHLGKGRGISTRNALAKAPEKLAEYDGIIQDYEKREFIGKAPKRTPFTKHCLSHHPVHKETSTTTATRPVYDASAKLPGRTCLNDWLYRGPVLLPTVPAVLLRSRLPIIIIVSDIGKAFLQMAVKESHRDCLWFVWFKDPTREPTDDNLVYYRFNRVPFGLKSSPYLLAGVIKKHLESEGTPLAMEMLKNCYVDNVLLMADTVDEALQKYRDSKAIFAKAQMPLREYASNNSEFNDALDIADRADLHKLRELGIRWDVTADYWDIPLRPKLPSRPSHSDGRETGIRAGTVFSAPSHTDGKEKPAPSTAKSKRKRRKGVDDGRLTKRFMLRLVAQIFDPLGLVQAILLLAKLVIQELWKNETDWDDDVAEKYKLLWEEAIKDFDTTTIRIPRRISTGKIHSAEVHIFTDGSSQAYGATAYLRVTEPDGTYRTNLVYARSKVKPIKDADKFTIPRMELLGVLIGTRIAKFLHTELSVPITSTYLWSDSTIVLHQVAEGEKVEEVFVENRLKEIRRVRDELHIQFRYVPTDDNPADIASRGIPAAELQRCKKW